MAGGFEPGAQTGNTSQAQYWEQVMVLSPDGRRFVVNISGPLTDTTSLAPPIPDGGRSADVRGQAAQSTGTSLTWIEAGRAEITILANNIGTTDATTEMNELAGLLQPVITDLRWSNETPHSQLHPDGRALLGGRLADTSWQILDTPNGLRLATGADLSVASESTSLGSADEVNYSIEPVDIPGGVVVHGDAPHEVDSLILRSGNSEVALPIATLDTGRIAFAVPIDDRLDPIAIDFLGVDGDVLGSIPLDHLPPYLGGVIGSGFTIR